MNDSDESLQIFALALRGLCSAYLLYFRESFFHIDPKNVHVRMLKLYIIII